MLQKLYSIFGSKFSESFTTLASQIGLLRVLYLVSRTILQCGVSYGLNDVCAL